MISHQVLCSIEFILWIWPADLKLDAKILKEILNLFTLKYLSPPGATLESVLMRRQEKEENMHSIQRFRTWKRNIHRNFKCASYYLHGFHASNLHVSNLFSKATSQEGNGFGNKRHKLKKIKSRNFGQRKYYKEERERDQSTTSHVENTCKIRIVESERPPHFRKYF